MVLGTPSGSDSARSDSDGNNYEEDEDDDDDDVSSIEDIPLKKR